MRQVVQIVVVILRATALLNNDIPALEHVSNLPTKPVSTHTTRSFAEGRPPPHKHSRTITPTVQMPIFSSQCMWSTTSGARYWYSWMNSVYFRVAEPNRASPRSQGDDFPRQVDDVIAGHLARDGAGAFCVFERRERGGVF